MIAASTVCCTVVVHIFFRGNGKVPYVIRKVFLNGLARVFCMIPPASLPQVQQAQRQQQALLGNQIKANHKASLVVLASNQTTSQPTGNFMSYLKRKQSNPFQTVLNMPPAPVSRDSKASNEFNKNLTKSCDHLLNSPSSTKRPDMSGEDHPNSSSFNQDQYTMYNELNLNFNLIENDVKEIRDYLRHTRKKLETTEAKNKQTNEWKQVALVLDRALFYIYLICTAASLVLMFPRWMHFLLALVLHTNQSNYPRWLGNLNQWSLIS